MKEFTLPELGENVTQGEVLRLLVRPGDSVSEGQAVLEVETDKATIEVPSSVGGRVDTVRVGVGDSVTVGQVLLTVDETAPAGGVSVPATPAAPPAPVAPPGPAVAPPAATAIPQAAPVAEEVPVQVPVSTEAGRASEPAGGPRRRAAAAAPSVRRMARELGLDINEVPGTGAAGRISIEDVKAHAKRLLTSRAIAASGPSAPLGLPDFSRWGAVDRQPLRSIRRRTAEHLAASWAAVPHVTQHDMADITALEELRKRYGKQAEAAGAKLTVTAIVTKIVGAALKVFPQFNASLDLAAGVLIYKKYVNIGIAVDTDRGLLVPVVKGVDERNIIEIAVEIAQLSEKARAGKLSLEDMQGGCFSISNLGGIGGTAFTPIVNIPEVAILGMSRSRMEPVWNVERSEFAPRLMLPLSLSYDHRVIDGADGIRFLRWIAEALEEPFLLALEG